VVFPWGFRPNWANQKTIFKNKPTPLCGAATRRAATQGSSTENQ